MKARLPISSGRPLHLSRRRRSWCSTRYERGLDTGLALAMARRVQEARPDLRLPVTRRVGNEVVGEGVAHAFRPDLLAAGCLRGMLP